MKNFFFLGQKKRTAVGLHTGKLYDTDWRGSLQQLKRFEAFLEHDIKKCLFKCMFALEPHNSKQVYTNPSFGA